MTYGYELEFFKAVLKNIEKNYQIKVYDLKDSLDYRDFALKPELEITEFGRGGELISPIYTKEEFEICKKELKEKLYILKTEKAWIKKNSEKTGFHIHLGRQIFENDRERYEFLFKFLIAFQEEIFDFAKGNDEKLRSCAVLFAAKLNKSIIQEIIETNSYFAHTFSKYNCIRLTQYNTFELRYFNASLEYEVLVNYLLFALRLGEMWENKSYDRDLIEYYYKRSNKKVSKERTLAFKNMFYLN